MTVFLLCVGGLSLLWFAFFYITGTPRDRRIMRLTLVFGAALMLVLSSLLYVTGHLHP